jgi:hypothetical protein
MRGWSLRYPERTLNPRRPRTGGAGPQDTFLGSRSRSSHLRVRGIRSCLAIPTALLKPKSPRTPRMIRTRSTPAREASCTPRGCGDDPDIYTGAGGTLTSSPRTRGRPVQARLFRTRQCPGFGRSGRPRAGGAGPDPTVFVAGGSMSSPRRRGWSPGCGVPWLRQPVVPAQAGLIPDPSLLPPAPACRRRAGGAVPASTGKCPSRRSRARVR